MRAAGRPPRAGGEEGFVLFLAILVLLIATVAGLATMLATSTDLTLSGNETKVSKVFYAADSGVGCCAAQTAHPTSTTIGGQMPVGISSNYSTTGSGDIQVTITRPLVIGQQVHPGTRSWHRARSTARRRSSRASTRSPRRPARRPSRRPRRSGPTSASIPQVLSIIPQ